MMLIRDDGMVVESVSIGCIEDDLIERVESGKLHLVMPEVTSDDVTRFSLPCDGKLQLC